MAYSIRNGEFPASTRRHATQATQEWVRRVSKQTASLLNEAGGRRAPGSTGRKILAVLCEGEEIEQGVNKFAALGYEHGISVFGVRRVCGRVRGRDRGDRGIGDSL